MKTRTFVYRNTYLIFLSAFLLNSAFSYSQQTTNQKAKFGFQSGFYFPEQKINPFKSSGDTSTSFTDSTANGNAIYGIYFPRLIWENLDYSSNSKFCDPLCRIPEYTSSELDAMHKQQNLMWEQYYSSWQKQEFIRRYSVDLEGVVKGFK